MAVGDRCRRCGKVITVPSILGDRPNCNTCDIIEEQAAAQAGARRPSTRSASKCFIATAAWGTDQAEDVLVLRAFRDQWLGRSRIGRAFVAVYELASPPVADWLGRSETARSVVRSVLRCITAGLTRRSSGLARARR